MKESTFASLRQVPMFRDLTEEEIKRVEEITIPRFTTKKSVIFLEGSEKEAIFFIKSGLVKTYKTDDNGHEQIVSFLKTGDMFPHTGFFDPKPYPATAETIIDTQLLAIPIRLFEKLLMDTPSIAIKLMRMMGDIIRELQDKIQVLSGKDVKQRALAFLLKLVDQHGEHEENKITINLPMTHQEFANSIGTTRETINRLFSQIAKEEIIEVDRNRIIIINIDALKEQMEPK